MLVEAATDTITLADVPSEQVHEAARAALMRLHLYILGETHQYLLDVGTAVSDTLQGQELNGYTASLVLQNGLAAWDEFINRYTELLARGQMVAASIPFGVWAVLHDTYVRPQIEVQESSFARMIAADFWRNILLERIDPDVLFQPQLRAIVDAANQRTWEDGLNLSRRIWNLDAYGRAGLNTAVSSALSEGKSAWELAEDVEQFLGAGRNCPRWARARLRLTKREIGLGDRTGLHTGRECNGRGVSYNAMRLARTEIQAIYNTATVANFQRMPFVEMEQIHLSAEHPKPDICDDVVNGGEDGDGVYEVGDIALPLHPNCLCYRTAVLMDETEFVRKLRGWMQGRSQWPAMDEYQTAVGGELSVDLRQSSVGLTMAYWLWGTIGDVEGLFWNMALR